MIKNNTIKKLYYICIVINSMNMLSCSNSNNNDITNIYNQRKLELEDGWESYLDKEKKFIINYPSNWQIENIKGADFSVKRVDSLEKVFLENFHLVIREIDENTQVEKFADIFFEEQKSAYPDFLFKNKETGYVRYYKEKTYWTSYELLGQNDFKMFTLSVFIRAHSKIYQLNFYTIPERKEKKWILFENIINSLVIQ